MYEMQIELYAVFDRFEFDPLLHFYQGLSLCFLLLIYMKDSSTEGLSPILKDEFNRRCLMTSCKKLFVRHYRVLERKAT